MSFESPYELPYRWQLTGRQLPNKLWRGVVAAPNGLAWVCSCKRPPKSWRDARTCSEERWRTKWWELVAHIYEVDSDPFLPADPVVQFQPPDVAPPTAAHPEAQGDLFT